ncbi:helix-turn-helix domain-containing protein [Robbsia andropogonis]|uniref:helix-turn-helix domain-containing protein n=1 Tax=Robbsia andropogonis TaxID=28092 RepID=UPI000465CFEB|nr:helix-turn-helix transcriptional regulator [Robbsia andropogonis]
MTAVEVYRSDRVADLLAEAIDECLSRTLLKPSDALCIESMIGGVGSIGIFYVGSVNPIVVKIGRSDVLADEIAFYASATSQFSTRSGCSLPAVLCHSTQKEYGWFVIEAGARDTLEAYLYGDPLAMKLQATWQATVRAVIAHMNPVYQQSIVNTSWPLEEYHFHGRLKSLIESEALSQSAARYLGVTATMEMISQCDIIINGRRYPSMSKLIDAAIRLYPDIGQTHSAFIHGDLQVRNVIPRVSGDGYIFIDPRIRWEGKFVGPIGGGSPLYDCANLLHSVAGMSTILAHTDKGKMSTLCREGRIARRSITLWLNEEFLLQTEVAMGQMCDVISNTLDPRFLVKGWQSHLFAYAANSTIGWLKSIPIVRTRETWLCMFAVGVRLLHRATDVQST